MNCPNCGGFYPSQTALANHMRIERYKRSQQDLDKYAAIRIGECSQCGRPTISVDICADCRREAQLERLR